jgi:hypothetical protein
MLFLEKRFSEIPVLRLMEQALELRGSPHVFDHDSGNRLLRPPILEPYLLVHAQVNREAEGPPLGPEVRTVPTGLEGFPNLTLLNIAQSEGKELALEDVDPRRIGQLADVEIDPAVALHDAHLVGLGLLSLDEVRGEFLELLAGARDAVDQLEVDQFDGHDSSPVAVEILITALYQLGAEASGRKAPAS